MSACLNPNERHLAPDGAIGRLICADPTCGFLLEGALIEHWQVTTLLGRGSTADLYLATETSAAGSASTPSRVLVKILRPLATVPRQRLEQFLRQLLLLQHPHIHPLQAAGWARADGVLYLVSPYADQGSFFHYPGAPTPLPSLAVAGIVRQIADALQFAHARQVVHGRLKPENCLLVGPLTVQVSDFYRPLLAEAPDSFAASWMAPEQAYGAAEPASDQYALGIIAYELLRGHLPILGPDPVGAAARGVRYTPAPISQWDFDLPYPVEQTLRRALARQPQQRFESALEFASALQSALESRRGTTPPVIMPGAPTGTGTSNVSRGSATPAPGPSSAPPSAPVQVCLLPGHTAACTVVRWAPDGVHLASAGPDRSVRVWRIQQRIGAPVATLPGHTAEVLAVAWSPDGTLLASGGADATVRIWQAFAPTPRDPAPQAAWWGHDGGVTVVDWSPDGVRIATGGTDRTIRVWDTAGRPLIAWQAHGRGGVTAMRWSPDGTVLASAGADRHVSLWDAKSGAQLLTWEAHGDEVRRLAWHPTGSILASCGGKRDPRALLWNVQTGLPAGRLSGHAQEIVGLFWVANAAWLATASTDQTLRFWSAGTPFGEQSGLAFHVESTPLAIDGAARSGLIALGRSDLLIQVLQFAG